MAVQDYKINYKSDFVLTINGDAGWATQFCIKFWTGMPSQAYFVGFDGVKYVNCRVGDTPTQLLVMFDDHHLPIGPLRMQIAYHTTIEEFPGSVFDEVTNARDVIVTIDGTDYQVMLDFTGEDAPELEFDLPAYANEAERIQNELQRQQNEAARIEAELQREQATAAAVQGAENVNAQLNGTTLTVTNRQGVSTSVNTKGEQGEQGPVGPEGPQGEQGPQGVQGPKGETGATGATGATGPQGPTGVSINDFVETGETETDTLYNVVFSDSTTKEVAIPKGEKGDQGPVGPQGPQGPMGDVAVITPEQQAAFTMYSETGQNTNGPMTQKAVTDALNNIAASGVSYDNSESGLTAENVQGALDEINILNVSENVFDFENSESINPSSSNFSVTKDSENETITVATLKKISSSTARGGFTTGLEAGVFYQYSFDYENQISGAHIYVGNIDRGGLSVGSGNMNFNAIAGAIYVSLPKNTASGKTVAFSNISIIHTDYLKDTVNSHGVRITKNEQDIAQLEKDVVSEPLVIPFSNMTEGVGIISPTSHNWSDNSDYRHYYFARTDDMKEISVQGLDGVYNNISFLKSYNYEGTPSGTPDYCDGYSAPVTIAPSSTPDKTLRIPDDCQYIVVNKMASSSQLPDAVYLGYTLKSVVEYKSTALSTLRVPMEVGMIAYSGTLIGYNSRNDYQWNYYRNAGFIKLKEGNYSITCQNKGGTLRVFKYDSNRRYLSYTEETITSGTPIQVSTDCQYIRLLINDSVNTFMPKVTISGYLDDNCFAKFGINPQASGSTLENFLVETWYQTMGCDNDSTTNVQDDGELLKNRGLIQLPDNYDPDGKPTRLVIYCHGSGVVASSGSDIGSPFTSKTTAFDSSSTGHVDPTVFLKEGYAVMDMDSKLYTNAVLSSTNKDCPTPRVINCYKSGYDYVLRNYNICKDGVMLCGRSMGGARSTQLMLSDIPIIACCLVGPYIGPSYIWNLSTGNFLGMLNGFPSSLTWDTTAYYLTYDEWHTNIYDNYGKFMNSIGLLRAMNIPNKDSLFEETVEDGVVTKGFRMQRTGSGAAVYNPWDEDVFEKWGAKYPCPIKIFLATDDSTAPWRCHGNVLYKCCEAGGTPVELRKFTTGGHFPEFAHKTSSYTTRFGETLSDISVVYIEMIRFFRRYEQD